MSWEVLRAAGLTVIFGAPLALSGWALLDAARRPRWAWALADRNQAGWMAAVMCGVMCTPVGIGVSLYYLLRVRPTVAAAETGRIG